MKTRKAKQIEKELIKEGFITEKDIEVHGHISKPQHTPTPWKVEIEEQNGRGVFVSVVGDRDTTEIYTVKDYGNASREVKADAELIVRAVNFHQVLLNIAKNLHYESHPDLKTGCETCETIQNAEGKSNE